MGRTAAWPTRVKWAWAAYAIAIGAFALACDGAATTDLSRSGTPRLDLTPTVVTVPPGTSTEFIAAALTAAGDTADVTVTWQATGGSITDAGQQRGQHRGRYRAGMFCGDYTVMATARPGNYADTAAVTVACPVPVASVSVSPAAATLPAGGIVQLAATLRDAGGNQLTGRTVTWSSDDPAVATVDPSGVVAGVGPGTATITATREGVRGTAAVTVTAPATTSH